jgi:hypothetical protein
MVNYNELNTALKYVSQASDLINGILDGYVNFINSAKSFCDERDSILKKYNIGKFNIFTSIADGYYWKELFHSHVLGLILDPNTPEIGSIQYLTEFCRVLNEKNKNIASHDFSNTVKIELEAEDESGRERGNIDIFVYDETHCIIIENKLNNAIDQPDQLARYLRIAKNKGKEIYAIVYIPLYQKTPSFNYSDEYKKDIDEITKKLVILPAIELAEKYLDICASGSEKEKETACVYIRQYANLIKDLGGKSMTTDVDMEFLKKIFSNKESVTAAKNIAEVWSRKDKLIGEILREPIIEELNLDDFDDETKGKSLTDDISLVFWFQERITVGFVINNGEFDENTQTRLNNALIGEKQLNKYFEAVESNETEIFQIFNLDDFDGTIDEMKQILVEKYTVLEKCITENR